MGIFSTIFGNGYRRVTCRKCSGKGFYNDNAADEAGCASWFSCSECGGDGAYRDWGKYKNPGRGYIYVDENGNKVDK